MNYLQTSDNSEKKVRNKITIISFISSILVIYVHSDNMSAYALNENSIGLARNVFLFESFGNKLTSLAVPMFFLLSGMLLFRHFEIKNLKEKLKSRFFSIVIPYFIWASLYYLYFILVTRIPAVVRLINNGQQIEFSFLTYFKWLWPDAYYTLWFLKNLIIFIALTPAIWALLTNHFPKIPTGLVVILLLILLIQFGELGFTLPEGMIFYLIGCYIGINCKDYIYKRSPIFSLLGAVYFIVAIATGIAFDYLICTIILLLAVWFIMDFFITDSDLPWFMYISFFTYLAHDALLQGIKKLFLKLLGKAPVWALTAYIVIPVVVFLILSIVAYMLKKLTPKVWKILVGGR